MYTNEQILEAAEAAIQEMGADYVYRPTIAGCVYAVITKNGPEPSCLVGQIVFRLNPEDFKEVAIWEVTADGDTDAMAMAAKLVIVEVEEPILPAGAIDPDDVHTPGILVHRLVHIPAAPAAIWPTLKETR